MDLGLCLVCIGSLATGHWIIGLAFLCCLLWQLYNSPSVAWETDWVSHTGDIRPVAASTLVDVELKGGAFIYNTAAHNQYWGINSPIVAWRLSK